MKTLDLRQLVLARNPLGERGNCRKLFEVEVIISVNEDHLDLR